MDASEPTIENLVPAQTTFHSLRQRSDAPKFILRTPQENQKPLQYVTTPNALLFLILKMSGNNPFIRSEYFLITPSLTLLGLPG